jgi:hypothetical protein
MNLGFFKDCDSSTFLVELRFFQSNVQLFRNVFVAFIKPIAAEAFWSQSTPDPDFGVV